mgnify:FL=1
MERIYILGITGSGKTFLAKKLSKILKILTYDMDDIRFIKKFTKARTPEQRKKKVDKILREKKKWIFDGRGTNWERHAMLKADTIIWLLTPSYKRVFRIFRRYFQRRKDKSLEEKFLDQFNLIKYSLGFKFNKYSSSFNPLREFMQKNGLHPIILRNNFQVNTFLEDLQNKT